MRLIKTNVANGLRALIDELFSRVSATAVRLSKVPILIHFFAQTDGDNANAQSFKMTDTFTLTLPGYQGLSMMPSVIETFFGPPFDNFSPWCILVGF